MGMGKGISSPIIGATKEQYLEDAAEALSISLSADEMQYLEEAYMPHPIVGAIDKIQRQMLCCLLRKSKGRTLFMPAGSEKERMLEEKKS